MLSPLLWAPKISEKNTVGIFPIAAVKPIAEDGFIYPYPSRIGSGAATGCDCSFQ